MNEDEFKKLIEKGESERVEFKESLSLKDEIGENVSAFSNTGKGLILIGVSDIGEIKGVQIGKKTIEELANYIKQHTDNQVYPSVGMEIVNNKDIIFMKVNESDEKPVFFKGRSYARIGRTTHRLSASEIRKLAKESLKNYWDEKICEGASLNDIDKTKVEWYLEQREKHRNISKKIKVSLNQFLENIKAIKNKKPTNAGILFFGKHPLLKLPVAQLRLVRLKGKEIGGIILDRVDCEGTLWEMVEQSEKFLKEHINFMGFRTEKSFQREDRFDIPIKALRELIINALVHRDYETTADVRIFIFDDRVEIINPGNFPRGVTPKRPLHNPVNKVLSQYMYDIGFIEKYGSGIITVRHLLKENGNRDLDYFLREIETKVIAYSHVLGKRGVGAGEKLGVQLNGRQKKAVEYLKKHASISILQYTHLNKVSDKTARRDLIYLVKEGFLVREGVTTNLVFKLRSTSVNFGQDTKGTINVSNESKEVEKDE